MLNLTDGQATLVAHIVILFCVLVSLAIQILHMRGHT